MGKFSFRLNANLGESENNGNLVKALEPLIDSMNRADRNLRVLHDALKIISDRQKKNTEGHS